MTPRHTVFAGIALIVASSAAPAAAGQLRHEGHAAHWRATHQAIYEQGNDIALLEADPEADDGYKAPVITRARTDIRWLRATLPAAQWRWTSPCCYSRRPIYIR